MSDQLLICGVDFETTGLDLENDRIVEIGAVLWDARASVPLEIVSDFIHRAEVQIPAETTAINGITQEMLNAHGRTEHIVFGGLLPLMDRARIICAHNGSGFDRPMFENHMGRLGPFAQASVEAGPLFRNAGPKWLWIDTSVDVPYPEKITTRNLRHLAAEHGFLNPFPHRAVFDVLTMLKVLSCYDIDQVIETAKQPTMTCIAQVSYDDREKAKARGYRWRPEKKLWIKHVKSGAVDAEKAACAKEGFSLMVREFDPKGDK